MTSEDCVDATALMDATGDSALKHMHYSLENGRSLRETLSWLQLNLGDICFCVHFEVTL